MSTTKTIREIPLDEVRRTLSGALGPAYTVTATSDSTLKVRRFPPRPRSRSAGRTAGRPSSDGNSVAWLLIEPD